MTSFSKAGCISSGKARLISEVEGGWMFLQFPEYPDKVIAGSYTGLLLLERQGGDPGSWKFKTIIAGFEESCREMEIDKEGSIWISHGYKGEYRIKLNDRLDSITMKARIRFSSVIIFRDLRTTGQGGLAIRAGNNTVKKRKTGK